jgi:glycosyltransferase involved in cell wall biosynthesis
MQAASIIVAVYNRLNYLELLLEGFKRQTRTDFEVLIADDGSTDPVCDFIANTKTLFPFPLRHIRQEKTDFFGKVRIVNKAITKTDSDYLIFTDGDCVPHREFVAMHLSERESGRYLVGRSAMLSEKITGLIGKDYINSGKLDGFNLTNFFDSIFGKTNRYLDHSLMIRNEALRKIVDRHMPSTLIGRNFSAWKSDFVKVNGYEEDFAGAAGEDLDLGVRLINAGVQPKLVIHRAINYHLCHEAVVQRETEGKHERHRNTGVYRAEKGLDQYLY